MGNKPSERIYELAFEYDSERATYGVVPSQEAITWATVRYLDEQSEKSNAK